VHLTQDGQFVPAAAGLPSFEGVNSAIKTAHARASHALGTSEEGIRRDVQASSLPDSEGLSLASFQRIEADDNDLDQLAKELEALEGVEGCYIKPPTLPPVWKMPEVQPFSTVDALPPGATGTPNFRSRQRYLDPAPGGVNAPAAWALPGGAGLGIRVIDIEGGWDLEHEDLRDFSGGLLAGNNDPGRYWRNHGSAVLGEIGGDLNQFGIVGIAYDAHLSVVSQMGLGSAGAIRRAAQFLRAGDVLLLEMHRPGPAFNYEMREDQRGFIAVEWWPDDLEAIRYAVSRGVIVVEAAGNGGEDLDSAIYQQRPHGFPANWRNPFRRDNVDSGAVIVGAGGSSYGTNDRKRLNFSNFGQSVDCQGWGEDVTTLGYGDLRNSNDPNFLYTRAFAGTSSASPMVTGCLGLFTRALSAAGRQLLRPREAREALRVIGSPQRGNTSQRIGPLPDLAALLSHLFPEIG
jgi:subtilisin family serine protease